MQGVDGHRHIAARDLVFALRARLHAGKALCDRIFDGAVIAELEMQAGMILDRAPVAAEKSLAADEIERPGDPAASAPGHHQEHVIAHGFMDKVEKGAGQIGPPPFARAGILIESPEGLPVLREDFIARQHVDGAAKALGARPLLADRLALSRG